MVQGLGGWGGRRGGVGVVQPQNLNTISANFSMTRQAISLHIKILEECGLVEVRQQGRERFCEARLEKFNEVHEWTEKYKAF